MDRLEPGTVRARPRRRRPRTSTSTASTTASRVDGDDGHHLQRARRVRAGEVVTAADGYGRWRVYTVVAAGRGRRRSPGAHRARARTAPASRASRSRARSPRARSPSSSCRSSPSSAPTAILLVDAARSVVRWDDAKVGAGARAPAAGRARSRRAVPPRARAGGRRPGAGGRSCVDARARGRRGRRRRRVRAAGARGWRVGRGGRARRAGSTPTSSPRSADARGWRSAPSSSAPETAAIAATAALAGRRAFSTPVTIRPQRVVTGVTQ